MRQSDKLVLGFTAAYLAVAAPYAYVSENHEFIFYIGVMLALIGLVVHVHRRVQLHPTCLWLLSLWGLAHMAGGLVTISEEVGVLYSYWLIPGKLKYDQIVHAYGFAVTTWAAWQGLSAGLADPRPTAGMLFLAACAGIGLGATNEVVEFIAVLSMPDTNVGDYANTSWDLVANTLGALVAVTWIRLAYREVGQPDPARPRSSSSTTPPPS